MESTLTAIVVIIVLEIVWFYHRYQTKEEREEHRAKLIWAIVITIVVVLVVAKLISSGSSKEYAYVAVGYDNARRNKDNVERPAPVPLYYDQICYGKDPCAPGQIHRAEWERSKDKADKPAFTHPDIADALGGTAKVKHAARRKWLPFGKRR